MKNCLFPIPVVFISNVFPAACAQENKSMPPLRKINVLLLKPDRIQNPYKF